MTTMPRIQEVEAVMKLIEGMDKELASYLIAGVLAIHGNVYAYDVNDKYLGKVKLSHFKAGVTVLKVEKDRE